MSPRPSPVTVGVTGLHAGDNPGPGVAVARALRADPAFEGSLVGLGYDAFDAGLHVPGLFDRAALLPYPSAGPEALLQRLVDIHEATPIDVLLPCLDSELAAVIELVPQLAKMGIHTALPTAAQLRQVAKLHLPELNIPGLQVPRTTAHHSAASLATRFAAHRGMLVLKGPLYDARVCAHLDEGVAAFHDLAARWGLPVLAQDHVDGEEYDVCAVGDGRGGTVGAVTMKKLQLSAAGKALAGVAVQAPVLEGLADAIFAHTHWRGPCELELRRDRQDRVHLLEINPRFPAWCDLTTHAGCPLPTAAVALAMGRTPPQCPPAKAGVAFVRATLDQFCDMGDLESLTMHGHRTAP